ncbi:UNVERIFIED_CONTAM: hypothetical protein H355_012176 [Colinus virginianus]|nr:hypothetical protein H355_012176 [Colinus virginianus]
MVGRLPEVAAKIKRFRESAEMETSGKNFVSLGLWPREKVKEVPMASWMLCVALVLAAVAGAVGETRYEKFLRQHVDYPRTLGLMGHRYCGVMLARRQVTAPGRPCKPTNTLVHAPAEDLVATCTRPAGSDGSHITSTRMDITTCRLRGRDTRPPCNYRALQLHHYVRVSCLDGLPVHLAGTNASLNAS